ncbi:uncharacterized protein J4E79_011124 [Alternaria viburni]|uniref:uncharacterized protein n=1 Tax=Alternaria viburni TaxID=566460 RepID=UPI0020C44046|nr:uncharacterized protein J4E79_011124 [Alternaria viburni]KAI4644176.1 hypothetical protein J4E79_011124 [Alternaria viburni]
MAPPTTPSSQRFRRTIDELVEHNLIVDCADKAFPRELSERVEQMLNAPVMPEQAHAAQEIVYQHREARSMDKKSAVNMMEPLLLFQGERTGYARGIPNIDISHDYTMTTDFVPIPPSSDSDALRYKPDLAIGYLNPRDSETGVDSGLTEEDNELLENFTLNPELSFPFLTAEWEAADGHSILNAMKKSALHGATIVNYHRQYFESAYGDIIPATSAYTMHMSVTCDMMLLQLWLHWSEGGDNGKYFMKELYSCSLSMEKQIAKAQAILKSHLDWALADRLQAIKDALPLWQKARAIEKASHELKEARRMSALAIRGSVSVRSHTTQATANPKTPRRSVATPKSTSKSKATNSNHTSLPRTRKRQRDSAESYVPQDQIDELSQS